MEFLQNLFPQAPSYLTGLLGQEQALAAQQQAQQQGLLGLGLGLLQAAAPAPVRPSIGAGLAQGLAAGQQAYQNVFQQRVQEQMMAQQIAEMQKKRQQQEMMQRIVPTLFQTTTETVPGEEGQPPTQRQRISVDPQRLQLLAAASTDPLTALKNAAEAAQNLRKAGLVPGGIGGADPFAPFMTSDNPNIRAVAQQYSRAYQSGMLDETTAGQRIESLARLLESTGKPIADIASYENYRKQEIAEGRTPKSYEDFLVNLRRSGAGTASTIVYPPGTIGPGTAAQNKIDETLLGSGSRLQVLDRISTSYRPEFLQTRFKAAQSLVGLGEKLGREPTPDERANLEQFSRFRQDAVRQLNQYINEITGAAIGQGEEAERLKAGVPNPGSGLFDGDSPTQFVAKLNNTIRDLRLAEARLQYIKTQGFNIRDVKLEDMPNIMRKRKGEIIKDFGLDENKEEDREVLKNRLAAEFGLLR